MFIRVSSFLLVASVLSSFHPVSAQSPSSPLAGTWIAEAREGDDPVMGHPARPTNASRAPRVVLDLSASAVNVRREVGQRSNTATFPIVSAASLRTSGIVSNAAAVVGGVLTTAHRRLVFLPEGTEVAIETVETYTLQADGRLLLVRTVTTNQGRDTRQMMFRKLETVR